MTWFAFKGDGSVYDLNGLAEKELASTFAHGYGTMADALGHPNDPANPAQASLLASFNAAASAPAGGGIQGVIQIVTVNAQGQPTGKIGPANNPAVNAAKNAAKGALGTGWNLTFGNTTGLLSRILKVVIGGILLIAGVLKLSNADKKLEQVLPLVGGPAGRVLRA